MHRNQSVNVHQFAMVPRADIPRSGFKIETSHKTAFDSGYLVPIYVTEILPGDSFNLRATIFGRVATPVVPIMDNLYLETFFFFVPNRLVWPNWVKFMGEQQSPTDSTDFVVPTVSSAAGGFAEDSIYDYFGIPVQGQVTGTTTVNALPLRAYNLIYNEWFRDENLQTWVGSTVFDDGPDNPAGFVLRRRGKRHDYFTSCLPWVQKGPSVTLPLGSEAPIRGIGTDPTSVWIPGSHTIREYEGHVASYASALSTPASPGAWIQEDPANAGFPKIYADLSEATSATINQLRQSFQVQKLLERDARGGTRYTELVRAHFGVISPDARLQRPEYLGGGMTPIAINPVPQTSETAVAGTPQGNLAAFGTVTAHGHGFTQSFTEHGYIIGLASIRADLGYQQGLRKMWSRSTKYDFYWPAFAMLGEQAVLQKEIYCTGVPAADDAVFGYQERWAEYRYQPSLTTGKMSSTHPLTLDVWHLAQYFATPPALNSVFIEDHPPVDRMIATTEGTGEQFIVDMFFHIKAARPIPMYSVPGLVDHF